MRALVLADGEFPSPQLLRELAEAADVVVAADGAADKALAAGIEPDVVIGDLDSVSGEARARLGPDRLLEDDDRYRTDLEKAIAWAIGRGCTAVDVAGFGGGRADHALANLSVLVLFRGQASIRLVDDQFEVRLVDGEARVEAEPGTVVSLVAIGTCRGVTTENLRWNLHDATLRFSPLGVHNEVEASPASVRVREGDLLLFQGRWVERHE
ncbi:Thiamine pyrophosphokinase [bacterium HR29]|nr:Thiamine pyrophosphokinase [bacterium HR29]